MRSSRGFSLIELLVVIAIIAILARPSRLLFFIHEARSTINDGNFNWWSLIDLPDDVHWKGTTLVYLDGHARHASKTSLLDERDTGWWNPDIAK